MLVAPERPLAAFPPITSSNLAKAALVYATAGIPVFPLCPGDKIPRVAHGFHDATTDLACIRQWWHQWPEANIGVPTGEASRLVVLDIDPRHGGHASFRHLQCMLDHHAADLSQPPIDLLHTCRSRSGGGGLHLFFGWSPSPFLHSTTRLAGEEGLDLRGEGGHIVVAPSRLLGGGIYRFLPLRPVQPFPEALIHLLVTRKQALVMPRFAPFSPLSSRRRERDARRSDPAYWLEFVLAQVSIGSRHEQALFLACRLVQEAGLSPAEAAGWMREYVRCVPQGLDVRERYPERDALACLAWAGTHVS
jgi:Bifunctional DNA primase/polymerase, N-terminal